MVWQLDRHHMIMDNMPNVKRGDVVGVEHDWVKTFVLLPRRTVGNRWVWLKSVYIRRVWVYTGFIDEPETQYGDLFDILK